MHNHLSQFCLAGSLALVACASNSAIKSPTAATSQRPPTTTTTSATTTPPSSMRAEANHTQLSVSDEILNACNIDFAATDNAPKFQFDKSELDDADRDVLRQLARCVSIGPLRGRSLVLVGRADPRGEDEYNMSLGGWRAASVQTYLSQMGVDPNKITETSRGKLDATGTDEAGWRIDRRVDILLSDRGVSRDVSTPR